MNTDFLKQEYFGNSVELYLRFIAILILALLLKRYLSSILARLFFTFFKKFSDGFYGQQFRQLLLRPIEGIVVTVLFYIAFYQLSFSLEKLMLLKRFKAIEGGKEVTNFTVSIMDVVDHLFFLFILIYFALLISRILDFVFLVFINKAKEKDDRERQQILPLMKDVFKVILWLFTILSLLGVVFHVNVATLVAGFGVGGIAIAFAAKESLENLLASFMVMIDKPFTIGDWVKINNVEGYIEKVGFRSTRIRSFDKSIISIPNRQLIDNNLENFSERGMRRVVFSVGAIYGLSRETLEKTMEEIRRVIINTPGITGQPAVHLESFGASSVNIQIVYFVTVSSEVDFGAVKEKVYFGVYEVMYKYAKGFAYTTQLSINGADVNEVFPPKPETGITPPEQPGTTNGG